MMVAIHSLMMGNMVEAVQAMDAIVMKKNMAIMVAVLQVADLVLELFFNCCCHSFCGRCF